MTYFWQNPVPVTLSNPRRRVREHLLPGGARVRVWLSDEPIVDKWTVVIRGPGWDVRRPGFATMLGLSDRPSHPQGVSEFTEGMEGKHLGHLVPWEEVPVHLRRHITARLT